MNEDVLTKSRATIEKSLQRVASKKFAENPDQGKSFISETMSRIQTSTDPRSCVGDVDLVLEAIVENLKIKQVYEGLITAWGICMF